jgi:hypothetical protein
VRASLAEIYQLMPSQSEIKEAIVEYKPGSNSFHGEPVAAATDVEIP